MPSHVIFYKGNFIHLQRKLTLFSVAMSVCASAELPEPAAPDHDQVRAAPRPPETVQDGSGLSSQDFIRISRSEHLVIRLKKAPNKFRFY